MPKLAFRQPSPIALDLRRVFRALGNHVRLRILEFAAQHKEVCVCELVAELGLSQSVVSRHVAVLKDAGLLTCRKVRLWVFYRPNLPVLRQASHQFPNRLAASLKASKYEDAEARVAACAGRE